MVRQTESSIASARSSASFGMNPTDGLDFMMRFGAQLAIRGFVSAATVSPTSYVLELTGTAIPDVHLLIANVVSTVVIALFQAYADNQLDQEWSWKEKIGFEVCQLVGVVIVSSLVHVGCGLEFTPHGVSIVSVISYAIVRIAYTTLRVLLSCVAKAVTYMLQACKCITVSNNIA